MRRFVINLLEIVIVYCLDYQQSCGRTFKMCPPLPPLISTAEVRLLSRNRRQQDQPVAFAGLNNNQR